MNEATSIKVGAAWFKHLRKEIIAPLELPPGGIFREVFGDQKYIDLLRTQLRDARDNAESLRIVKGNAYRVADCKYLVSGKVITLTEVQDIAIRSLIELGGTAKLDELRVRSGSDGCNKVLARIVKTHPELRAYIKLPEKRARGGYSTTIANSVPDKM